MNTSAASIAGRAAMALVLMIGFYLLAVAIAGCLLWIPYAEVTYAHRVHFKLAAICLIAACAILWSIFPRIDRFTPPGPRLTREQHPRLFAELEGVARAVKQEMPAEVYLVPDVNAWVTERGGIMGFGSRRVMGLGLALMRVLTCSQMRAVIAHEFGHFYGGDTKLGPWVYKTRGAIGRTLSSLAGEKGQGSLLQLPFLWYGKMFLRITHAVSRRQEFQADELAARTVGSVALTEGLRKVHGVGPAFGAFWSQECAPVVVAGFQPPLGEGFERFIHAENISKLISATIEEELKEGKTDPYDTHPPLKERIAAVAGLPPGPAIKDEPAAVSLLESVPELEHALWEAMLGAERSKTLQPIRWEETCAKVYWPQWNQLVRANSAALAGITLESLPERTGTPAGTPPPAADAQPEMVNLAKLQALGLGFVQISGEKPEREQAANLAGMVLSFALLVALAQRGADIEEGLGKPVTARLNGEVIEPLAVPMALASGKLAPEDWVAQCARLGLTGVDLGLVGGAEQPPATPTS